jgi:hypothetical protein
MATANPYDRRESEKRRIRQDFGQVVDVGGYAPFDPFDLLADGRRAYPGFSLGRLEELLRDEFARGFNAGEGTMERKTEEEILPRVRRQVWDEGRAAGLDTAESEVLVRIAEQFEERAQKVVAQGDDVLANDGASRDDLRTALEVTQQLLRDLVHAHHCRFQPEPPF